MTESETHVCVWYLILLWRLLFQKIFLYLAVDPRSSRTSTWSWIHNLKDKHTFGDTAAPDGTENKVFLVNSLEAPQPIGTINLASKKKKHTHSKPDTTTHVHKPRLTHTQTLVCSEQTNS